MALSVARGISQINNHKIKCHTRLCLELEAYRAQCNCPKIQYSINCKYLGLQIDNTFKMKQHVITLCKKLRTINFQFNKSGIQYLPLSSKKLIYHGLIESLLRYGVTLYTYSPAYILNPLNSIQRKILKLLFGRRDEITSSFLSPTQLSKMIILTQHFQDPKYRQIPTINYKLRKRNLRPAFARNKYGERKLEHVVPKLINKYCQHFLEEEHFFTFKSKIKESLIRTDIPD